MGGEIAFTLIGRALLPLLLAASNPLKTGMRHAGIVAVAAAAVGRSQRGATTAPEVARSVMAWSTSMDGRC